MANEFYLLKKRENYEPYIKLLEQYPPDDAKLAFRDLCRNDLFFLLVYGMNRTFADNDWFFARCREVQDSPDWHIDLWFREGGKSLCITVAKTIQDIFNDPEITVGIFSHTRTMAKSFLRVIKREFEINVKLKTAFDDILWADPQKQSPKWSLDINTPVLTTRGWKKHGDLVEGDKIFGSRGQIITVLGNSGVMYNADCRRVIFDDCELIASSEHLWPVECKKHSGISWNDSSIKIKQTDELTPRTKIQRMLPTPILKIKSRKNLLVDPYILGLWLGDGTAGTNIISMHRDDEAEVLEQINNCGYEYYIHRRKAEDNFSMYGVIGLKQLLEKLGCLRKKHIPQQYMMGSVNNRLSLLQGLMDSDGTCKKDGAARAKGMCTFSNTNADLAKGFLFLATSLGMRPSIYSFMPKTRGRKMAHHVYFVGLKSMPPFRSARKLGRCKSVRHKIARYLRKVEKIDSVPVNCIKVDAEDSLYLAGSLMVPTHNSEDDGLIVKRAGNPPESTVEACGLVEGMPTGRHYQLRVYDDVLTQDVAASAPQMQKVMDALDMSQHLGKVGGAARMIGTRYSLGDVYEQYIKRGQFKPRIKPATDNGLVDGNPVMFSQKVWEQKINSMSAAILASQMLQNPMASDSVIFQSDWFNLWPADKALPIFDAVYQCFDGATSAKQTADYSCLMTFGIWKAREGDAKHSCMVLDCFMEQWAYPDVRDEVLKQYQNKFGADERQVDGIIVEDKSSGSAMIPEFRRSNMNVIAFNPGKLDKIARANLVSPVVRDGRVWLPESRNPKFKGRPMTWLSKWWEQVTYFPNSAHDDGVDVMVSFLLVMDKLGLMRGKAIPPKESYWMKSMKKSGGYG